VKLLLDTNVIVDVLSRRDGHEPSIAVIRQCEIGKASGFISATTVTDVVYILRKHIPPPNVREAVQTLLGIVDVAGVLKSDISSALISRMRDFEDAVQAACALRIGAKYIVTRNLKDYVQSPVAAMSPDAVLEVLG